MGLEDNLEIASARLSSNYRKSMKEIIRESKIGGDSRNISLSKISEENSGDKSENEIQKMENKVNSCSTASDEERGVNDDKTQGGKNDKMQVTPVFEDERVISSMSNELLTEEKDEHKGRKVIKHKFLSPNFIPEFISRNKITIVYAFVIFV